MQVLILKIMVQFVSKYAGVTVASSTSADDE